MAYDGDERGLQCLITGLAGKHGLYRWQERLLRGWLEGRTWDAVDVPTGLGKTTVILLWLIARAAGADLPRRLIYVVDRRAVVDQATEEVQKATVRLDALLNTAPSGAMWRERLGLREGAGLPVSTLRGQHRDNRRWMEDPAACAIVVGTVDMVGSRLLFEGYGVNRKMRPVHAGLIGLDALLVLDEAHLVPPFEALVRAAGAMIGQDRDAAPTSDGALRLPPPLTLMSLSATGRTRSDARVFPLVDEDWGDPSVRARLDACKRLAMRPEVSPKEIAAALAEEAWALRTGPAGEPGRRVVVYCNRRQTAQEVAEILTKRCRDKAHYGKAAQLTELLVGERRYYERERLTGDETRDQHGKRVNPGSSVFNSFDPARHRDGSDRPVVPEGAPAFLIATSAGEVGVDLDADDLVCDLVAWERMVQRFGRVNRRPPPEGPAPPDQARVVVVPVAKEKEAEDVVEDADLARYRAPFVDPAWPVGDDDAHDVSPGALVALKRDPAMRSLLDAATTPPPLRPPLTRPTVEAWALTSLAEHPGRPKVAPWLRGWEENERPQTTVLWRRWFPLRRGEERVTPDLRAFFAAAPPHAIETLEAPTWRVANLLIARAKALAKAEQKPRKGSAPEVDDAHASLSAEDGPGVEEPSYADAVAPPPAVEASAATSPAHAPLVVVLGPDRTVARVYTRWALADANAEDLARDLGYGTVVLDARLGGLDEHGLLSDKADDLPATIEIGEGWNDLGRTVPWRIRSSADPSGFGADDEDWRPSPFRWVLDPEVPTSLQLWVEAWEGGDPDEDEPALSRSDQSLTEHHGWAELRATEIAERLRLSPPYVETLAAAAAFHDAGKARINWQRYARNPGYGQEGGPPALAKFQGRSDWRILLIGEKTVYRHEFGSLLDALAPSPPAEGAQAHARLAALPPALRDLALHLIAAHHGHARPMIAHVDERMPPSEGVNVAQEAALRFARLQAAWGPWGLAWWEALLRAADRAASRELNEGGEDAQSGEAARG